MSSITTEDFSSKKVNFIVGPAASGKSTLAYSINKNHCEADKYENLYDKKGNINFKLLKRAHKWCQSEFEKQLNQDNDSVIVVSNTFGNLYDFKFYLFIILNFEKNTGKKCEIKINFPKYGLRYFEEEGVVNEEQQEYRMIQERSIRNEKNKNDKFVPEKAMIDMIKKFKDNRQKLIEMSKLNNASDLLDFLTYRNFIKRDISRKNIIVRGKLICLDHIIKYEISNDQILKLGEDNIIDLPDKNMIQKEFHITIFYGKECTKVNKNDLIKEIDFNINSLFQTEDEGLFCLSVDTDEKIFNLKKRLHITLGSNRRKGYSPVNSNDLLEYANVKPYIWNCS